MVKRMAFKKPNFRSLSRISPRKVINKQQLIVIIPVILGLSIYGMGTYIWYKDTFTRADRVFYDMLATSLSTDSVVRVVDQVEGVRTINQAYYTTYTPNTVVQSRSILEQLDSNRQTSTVVTETIGDKEADYVRYTSINLPDGQPGQDYSSVIDQWAIRSGEQGPPQLLNESIFTFIPMGNFNVDDRKKLLDQIKRDEVYKINSSELYYQGIRPKMTMNLTINPKQLVTMLSEYAEMSGVGDKQMLDPAQYERSNNIGLVITIDLASRHLEKIDFPDEQRSETYQAYGLNRKVEPPKNTVSLEELQSRIAQ